MANTTKKLAPVKELTKQLNKAFHVEAEDDAPGAEESPVDHVDQPSQHEDPQVALAQHSLNVLIQAVEFAQNKGVYSFEDSHHIYTAIKTFKKV